MRAYFFFCALIFAHRDLAAAWSLAMLASEMRRFVRAVSGVLRAALLCRAQGLCCAAATHWRTAADMVTALAVVGMGSLQRGDVAIALSNRSGSCLSSLKDFVEICHARDCDIA